MLAFTFLTSAAMAAEADLRASVNEFLAAYARGDKRQVLAMSVPHGLHVYGSDVSEFTAGTDGLRQMLADDQRLWSGRAHFGTMRDVTSERGGNLATLFFNVDFILGSSTVPVRFATVWRLQGESWNLLQSSNVVPTTGQSASALTHREPGK